MEGGGIFPIKILEKKKNVMTFFKTLQVKKYFCRVVIVHSFKT